MKTFFSHKTQKIAIIIFIVFFLLSVLLYIFGSSVSFEVKQLATDIFIVVTGLSALIIPFSKETIENDTVREIRRETATVILAVFFCLSVIVGIIDTFLIAHDKSSWLPFESLMKVKGILLFELIYILVLKIRVRKSCQKGQ